MTPGESAPAAPAAGGRRQWWVIGGCGCLLLLGVWFAVGVVLVVRAVVHRPGLTGTVTELVPPGSSAAPLPVADVALPVMHTDTAWVFVDIAACRADLQAGNFAALETYYRAQLADRLDYDARYNLTQFVLQLGRSDTGTDAALQAWAAALPQSHLVHLLLGRRAIVRAWEARGDDWANTVSSSGWRGFHAELALADRELRRAYDLDPSDPNIGAMGITCAMGQNAGEAVERAWFDRAVAADPYHTWAWQNRMNALYPKWGGSWAQARAVVDEALLLTDSNPQLFVLLPLWHDERVARATDNSGNNARTDRRAAQQQAYTGELRDAYRDAAARYPLEYEIHARYAFAASTNREPDTAIRAFRHIIPLYERGQVMPLPHDEERNDQAQYIINKYAWMLATARDNRIYDPARALVYAQKAVALNPDWEWALDTLACAYAANGRFAEAIAAQREAQQHGGAGFQRHCAADIAKYERGESPRY